MMSSVNDEDVQLSVEGLQFRRGYGYFVMRDMHKMPIPEVTIYPMTCLSTSAND